MERLTKKVDGVYETDSPKDAVTKLGKFEDMYDALKDEYDKTVLEMEKLLSSGKKNSATYRQLFANKVTLGLLIGRFELYVD